MVTLPDILSNSAFERVLKRTQVARLATISAQGTPQLVPIVYVSMSGALWMPIDGKPKSTRALARLEYIRRSPQVGVLLDEYEDDWSRLWWVQIEATANVYALPNSEPQLEQVRTALLAKYAQYRQSASLAQFSAFVEMHPQTVRAWAARGRDAFI